MEHEISCYSYVAGILWKYMVIWLYYRSLLTIARYVNFSLTNYC